MCGLGTWELLIVLAIVVLLFGATRLPQLGKALGETVRNFKKGSSGPEAVKEPAEKKAVKAGEAREVAQLVEPAEAPSAPEVEDAEVVEEPKTEKND